MGQSKASPMLAERAGAEDDEVRLREALNRQADQFLSTLDSAMKLRQSGDHAKRMRALARSSLQDACLRGMEAYALSQK